MVHRAVGNVMVVVHGAQNPTDAEWDAMLATLQTCDKRSLRTLVWTDGGGPNALQRERLTQVYKGYPQALSAVMSASMAVRGIVTALNWFLKGPKPFAHDQLPAAYQYLGLTPEEISRVEALLPALRQELRGPGTSSASGSR